MFLDRSMLNQYGLMVAILLSDIGLCGFDHFQQTAQQLIRERAVRADGGDTQNGSFTLYITEYKIPQICRFRIKRFCERIQRADFTQGRHGVGI